MQTKIVSEEQIRNLQLDDILIRYPNFGKAQEKFDFTDPSNYTLYTIVNIITGTASSKFHLKSEHKNAVTQFMPESTDEIRAMLIKSGEALVTEKIWWLVS